MTRSVLLFKTFGLLIGFWLCGIGASQAQTTCTANEREMQAYFQQYKPGTAPDLVRLERAWERCASPTQSMQLVYYYFKAVQSLREGNRNPRTSYLDAAHYYYDRCVPHFSYLVNANAEDELFADLFIDRARLLETTLIRQENTLGIDPNKRYAYTPSDKGAQGDWLKQDLEPRYATGETSGSILDRGQGSRVPQGGTFNKRVRKGDGYETPEATGSLRNDDKGEPYGLVGNLGSLDLLSYLQWRSRYHEVGVPDNSQVKGRNLSDFSDTRPSAAQQAAIPRGRPMLPNSGAIIQHPDVPPVVVAQADSFRTRGGGLTRGESAPTRPRGSVASANTQLAINVMAPLALRESPNGSAAALRIVEFGEPVDLLLDEGVVVAAGMPFVRVQMSDGQKGWVERYALVYDGRIAVATQATRTYAQANGGQPQHVLAAGEHVVLADFNGDWIKLMTRNGEHEVWAYGRANFSIDATDIAIADAYQEAKMLADPNSRQAALLKVRQMTGYAQSPLRAAVEASIQGR